jgi:ATP-dependent Clp protease ATP-binding subunit ClpA
MNAPSTETLRGLEAYLQSRVVGQDGAVRRVARSAAAAEIGFNETGPRPKGIFLFLGPTGVGKTETAKGLSEALHGPGAISFVSCNEYPDPGDLPRLAAAVARHLRARPQGGVLLFDEFEKARAAIDLFLSLFDEGHLTLDSGERLFCAAWYFILTSNLGSAKFAQMEQTPYARMERFALQEARRHMRPELLARVTNAVVYRPLSQGTKETILSNLADAKVRHLERCFEARFGAPLPPTDLENRLGRGAFAHLMDHGFSQDAGARGLRKELDDQFNDACLDWFFEGKLPEKGAFVADGKNDRLLLT